MALIGYARVSTAEQDTALQTDALRKAGCERIFNEVSIRLLKTIPEIPFSVHDLHSELEGRVSLDALLVTVKQLRRLGGLLPAAIIVERS